MRVTQEESQYIHLILGALGVCFGPHTQSSCIPSPILDDVPHMQQRGIHLFKLRQPLSI